MEETEEETQQKGEERVSVTIQRYASGVSYRLVINDAKNFDDAIEKTMAARAKLVDALQKSGEKIITPSEYKRY